MNKEKQLFYNTMRNLFAGQKVTDDYSEYKERLTKIAIANKCFTLFYECAKQVNIVFGADMKSVMLQTVTHSYKNLTVQNNIIAHLQEHGIPCAVLKGASVAARYPEPILRSLGDIDLLVPQEDYEKSIDLLLNGKERDKLHSMHKFHYLLHIDGIPVEIHNAVAHFSEQDAQLKDYMRLALTQCKTDRIDDFTFPVLSERFQVLSLLLHTKTHYFENQLTGRMLLDWAVVADSISDTEWNDTIYPILEKLDLHKWADAMNAVCHRYLCPSLENKIHTSFDEDTTSQLADVFISDACRDGASEQKGRRLKNIISWVNEIARRDFSLTGRKKYLSPLFWPIIFIRYLYRLKIGYRKKVDIFKYSDSYHVKETLYRKIQESA